MITTPQFLAAIAIIASALIVGAIMKNNQLWYDVLLKPQTIPAPIVFGVVWLILYILLFVSYVMNKNDKTLIVLFYLILVTMIIWAIVTYNTKNLYGGLIALLFLNLFNVAYYVRFIQVNMSYSFVVLPYVIWVIYATSLAIQLYKLN